MESEDTYIPFEVIINEITKYLDFQGKLNISFTCKHCYIYIKLFEQMRFSFSLSQTDSVNDIVQRYRHTLHFPPIIVKNIKCKTKFRIYRGPRPVGAACEEYMIMYKIKSYDEFIPVIESTKCLDVKSD